MMCGFDLRTGYPVPKQMTWNVSALCDEHEKKEHDV